MDVTVFEKVVSLLRCLDCHDGILTLVRDQVVCTCCGTSYHIVDNVIDMLHNPHPEVIAELEGMHREFGSLEKMREMDREIRKHEEIRNVNFRGLCAKFKVRSGDRILDIGTGDGWVFSHLPVHRAEVCIGLDIHQAKGFPHNFPLVLADMNDLPFRDNVFHLCTAVATLHHSYDLPHTVKEIARVLSPGGRFATTEPIAGLLKRDRHVRDDSIHEYRHHLTTYLRAFREAGFDITLYFPPFVDEKLKSGDLQEVRFAKVARFISPVYMRSFAAQVFVRRVLLYAALVFCGIGLVAIAEKNKS